MSTMSKLHHWSERVRRVAVSLTVIVGALMGLAATAGTASAMESAPAASAQPLAGGWGYVTEGNLRTNPTLDSAKILTIYNQWVNILCWIDGGYNGFGSNRWFQAQYYDKQGYLSSGVVSSQPSVGHC